MKKLLFFILALFMVILLSAQQPIVIKGKIDNCPNRNRAFIQNYWFNPEKLQEEIKSTDFSIAEDGSFYIKIKDADDFYARYWIQLGNEKTHLDLIAGDSIYMTLDATWFDETIKYTGLGAGRNNYRKEVFLAFWDPNNASKVNLQDHPTQFLNQLNSLTNRKLELLNNYHLSKEIDSSYYKFERAMILNEKANQILSNNNHYHHHKFLPDSLSRQIAAIFKAADFSDNHFMQRNEFRELVTYLPGYLAEHHSIKPGADLNREIRFAHEQYTNLMQLYFNKENIKKYLWRTQSLSEKHALLNFFDNQFDEPQLKQEIQAQRLQIKNDKVVNSRIFQGSLFSIIALVLLVVGLFTIVKLIQLSSLTRYKSMKMNIALWLKVLFYLGIFIIALGFITNSNSPLLGLPFVILLLGTFLIHTYLLIPKYALKRDPRYFILSTAALIVFVFGTVLSGQESGSMYSILVLSDLFLALVLLSWTSYYIDQLASRKSTFTDLRKSGDLNLEIAFNLLALFLVNSLFVINVGNVGRLNEVILFYTILLLLYFHTFVSYPRFFNKKKAVQFVGINVFILLVATVAMIVMDAFQSYHALKNIGVASKMSQLISVRNIRIDLLIVFALMLIPSFIYYQIKKQLMNNESTGFKLYRKKEAELAQLKSQVNPHFLFNTLNTLYAFALTEGSDKTAECIAKLANLMRFMLDDMEKESILLKREISYIQDYVKLQSIRSAVEHEIAITVDMEDEEGYSIAPMLMIPFVENAFKHGMNPNKVSQLKIDVHAKDNQIQFVIENSVDENFEAYYKEKGFGIGIENVKSRLKHVYPDRHILSIAKTNAKFIVILTIDLM